MQLKTKIIIKYNWWKEGDDSPIDPEIVDVLDESTNDHIFNMRQEGYTSGELCDTINGVEYQGWWEMTTERKLEDE